LRANLKSITNRCHPILVAFVRELTKETIDLPLGCLQGGGSKLSGILRNPRTGEAKHPRCVVLSCLALHPAGVDSMGVKAFGDLEESACRSSLRRSGVLSCRLAVHPAGVDSLSVATVLGVFYQFYHYRIYQFRFYHLAADNLPITPISYHPPADNTILHRTTKRFLLNPGNGTSTDLR